MATDQEIRDAGLKYIPQQKYLQNPYELPVAPPPPAAGGITNTNAFTNSQRNDFSVYNPDPNSIVNKNYNPYNFRNAAENTFLPGGSNYKKQVFNPKQLSGADPLLLDNSASFKRSFDPLTNEYVGGVNKAQAGMAIPGQQVQNMYNVAQDTINQKGANAMSGVFPDFTAKEVARLANNNIQDYRQNYGAQGQFDNDSYYDTVDNPLAYSGQTELEKMKESYPGYFEPKPLEGIPGMMEKYVKNSFLGKGLGIAKNFANSILPVNRRSILENELGGQGIMVNDIGQIVGDGGNVNTAENIMAGYNASKVTADTFQKRRDMINEKMKDPEQKAAKLAALDAAEAKMLGVATDRTNTIYDDKTAKRKEKKKTSFLNRIFKNKKAADTTSTDTTDTTGTTGATTSNDGSGYTGTPGGNTGDPGGSFANIDNSGKNYGPYSSAAPSYTAADTNRESKRGRGRDADDKMARGGRAGYFFGGRAGFKNGGLAGLL